MKNKFIKSILMLGSLALTACGPSNSKTPEESKEPVIESKEALSDLKAGLLKINNTKNYTASVSLNGTYSYSIFVTEKYVGIDREQDNGLDFHVKGEAGIYPINDDDGITLSGQYEKDANGNVYTELFDNSVAKTMYGVQTDYVQSLSNTETTITFTNKFYKLALLDFAGFERNSYVDLTSASATYTNLLKIELVFGRNTYTLSFSDFGTSKSSKVEAYLASGKSVYTPDKNLATMSRLIRSNNYMSLIYDFDSGTDGAYNGLMQVFNPHYFYTTADGISATSGTKQGYIELSRTTPVTNTSSPYYIEGLPEAYGVYMFISQDNQYSLSNRTVYDTPDMEYFMHYPSLLKLLDKTQYFYPGIIREHAAKYEDEDNCYILYNQELIRDFAINFNFNNPWPFETCKPYALGLEITPSSRDASVRIVFHYCFTYNGTKKDYLVPFYSFGQTNNQILDGFYELYKD